MVNDNYYDHQHHSNLIVFIILIINIAYVTLITWNAIKVDTNRACRVVEEEEREGD